MTANMTEIPVNTMIENGGAVERTFDPLVVHEVMLEFDPKQMGYPICTLQGSGGRTEEIHPRSQKARPGHFRHRIAGDAVWNGIRVTMSRGKAARLLKLKLVGQSPGI